MSLREKEKEIELKLLQGVNYIGSQMTLNDMFNRYILTKKHKGKKLTQNTIINYTQMWNKHIKDSLLGNMKLVDIKKSDVVYLYETIKEKGLSYGTVLFYHKVITSVFNMAMDDDIISKNPTTRALDNIEGSQKRRTALTVEQQNEFLLYLYEYCHDMYKKVVFLLDTMCRLGEFAGLTWEDIDMKNHIITIDHQMQYKKYKGDKCMQYHINPTKTSNTRKIPMTERVYEVLCEQRKSYFVYADECIDGKRNFVFHT